jgi:hypothetical protein
MLVKIVFSVFKTVVIFMLRQNIFSNKTQSSKYVDKHASLRIHSNELQIKRI